MAQQTPYIGSKISLISKLDIRYEGILYTVDSQEATIALSKVKSFGTEDRPTPHPVPGRDEVYEYIIFKASDIKDLIVCDAPKPPPAMGGLPYDPAILSVSEVPKAQDHVQTSHSGTPRESPPLPIGSQAPSRAPGAGRPSNEGLPPQQPPRRGGFHPPQQQQQQYRPQRQEGGRGYHHQHGGYNNQHQPHQHYYNQNRGAGGHRGQQQHGRPPMRANQPREKLKFDSDFDFEKANEQFIGNVAKDLETKLNISESEKSSTPRDEPFEEEIPEDDHEKFYDKTSSFFDSISCEALEKQEGKNTRPDWRKERMTNQETFGQNAIRSLGYRRGGGGRGYGGQRGGQRGGGYGGNQRYNNGYSNYGGNRTYTSSNNRRNNATRGSATAGADF